MKFLRDIFENLNKLSEQNKLLKRFKPVINAKSAIAMDLDSHTILYGKNINEAVPFASIVKLMVASLIIEENNLDQFKQEFDF